ADRDRLFDLDLFEKHRLTGVAVPPAPGRALPGLVEVEEEPVAVVQAVTGSRLHERLDDAEVDLRGSRQAVQEVGARLERAALLSLQHDRLNRLDADVLDSR